MRCFHDDERSAKRAKLESIIYSISIADIGKMLFDRGFTECGEVKNFQKSASVGFMTDNQEKEENPILASEGKTLDEIDLNAWSSEYVPAIVTSNHPQYNYDCINMALLEADYSELDELELDDFEEDEPRTETNSGTPRSLEDYLQVLNVWDMDFKEDSHDVGKWYGRLEKDLELIGNMYERPLAMP